MQSNPITLLALHNAHSDEELTEDEMYSDDDNSAAGSLSKPPHSGLQFMITQKMRAKLLEELGYTSDEVSILLRITWRHNK